MTGGELVPVFSRSKTVVQGEGRGQGQGLHVLFEPPTMHFVHLDTTKHSALLHFRTCRCATTA